MKVRWQVRIQNSKWMSGVHNYTTRWAAQAFLYEWRKVCAQGADDGSAVLLRNGKPVEGA